MKYTYLWNVCVVMCLFAQTDSAFAQTNPSGTLPQVIVKPGQVSNPQTANINNNGEFVSGQVLLKYRLRPSTKKLIKTGNAVLAAQEEVVREIARSSRVRLDWKRNGFRPVHQALADKMKATKQLPSKILSRELENLRSRPNVRSARKEKLLQGAASAADLELENTVILELEPDQDVREAVKQIEANKDSPGSEFIVEEVSPNYIYHTNMVPNDTYYGEQWGLPAIKAPAGWDISTGGASAVIAIVDTGVDWTHTDLTNIWRNSNEIIGNNIDDDANGYVDDYQGWDFVQAAMSCAADDDCSTRDLNPMDVHGHGTHCAGIAAAQFNNNKGIAGVCPNCRIMPLRAGYKTTSGGGSLILSDIIDAIQYAVTNGADVISMSFGGPSGAGYADILKFADASGVVLVGAAGNNASSSMMFPGAADEVISVASVSQDLTRSSFSNFGPWVDVAAPGSRIKSLFPGNQYVTWDGTSMATPHVAGLAGLIAASRPEYNSQQIRWLIESTVQPRAALEAQYRPGFGIIQVDRALTTTNPPKLTARLGDPQFDVSRPGIVRLTGCVGGESFNRFSIRVRQESSATWKIVADKTTAVCNESLAEWDASIETAGLFVAELKVFASNGSALADYGNIDLGQLSWIQPEFPFNIGDKAGLDRYTSGIGIAKVGALVRFVGARVGTHHLEWRPSGGTWQNSRMQYDAGGQYLGTWNTRTLADGRYEIRLVDQMGSSRTAQMQLTNSLVQGFPSYLSPYNSVGVLDAGEEYSVVGNVDADAPPEIVTLRNYQTYATVDVREADGSSKSGWPQTISLRYGNSGLPTLANLTDDSALEILFTTTHGFHPNYVETLYAYRGDGSLIFSKEFPADGASASLRQPVIAKDFDNNGTTEIIYRSSAAIFKGDSTGVFSSFAQVSHSYPIPLAIETNMAACNMDSDSNLELVVAETYGFNYDGGLDGYVKVHAYNLDTGSEVPGWPREMNAAYGFRLVCGRIVRDPDTRDDVAVIITKNYKTAPKAYLVVIGGDGAIVSETLLPHYNVKKLLLADLNNDSVAEIILGDVSKIHAKLASGQDFPGWPYIPPASHIVLPHAVVDFNGDLQLEVVATVSDIYMFGEHRLTLIGSNGIEKPAPFSTLPLNSISTVSFVNVVSELSPELVVTGGSAIFGSMFGGSWRFTRPYVAIFSSSCGRAHPGAWSAPQAEISNINAWVRKSWQNDYCQGSGQSSSSSGMGLWDTPGASSTTGTASFPTEY